MRLRLLYLSTVLVAALAAGTAPQAAPAASGGWAWDSVTKFQMSGDQSSLQPGSFDTDFAAASSPQPEQSAAPSGGIFSRMQQAISMAQNMQSLVSSGIAEHHYLAGTKERTDQIGQMTATILDCGARTITRLDLRKKTYRVTSMDARDVDTGGSGGHSAHAGGDNTKVAVTVSNTSLGARDVNGQSTNGYRSNMTITEMQASGESHTQNADMVAYYSGDNNPVLTCYQGTGGVTNTGGMMTAGYARLMRALSAPPSSSRYSVKQSGPTIPLGRMAMWDAVTFSNGGTHQATVITERANLHPISADDPIFSIPAGFTEEH